MMYYTQWLAWLKLDYELNEKKFDFTQQQLDNMYAKYQSEFID